LFGVCFFIKDELSPTVNKLILCRGSPDADEANVVTPNNFESHLAAQNSTVDYIPVQRLVQSIKQVGPSNAYSLETAPYSTVYQRSVQPMGQLL
jgi:hypothetical protein